MDQSQFREEHPRVQPEKPGAHGGKPRGEFMHPTGDLSPASKVPLVRRLVKRELLPILPLFLAVGAGIGLAGWSAHRNLVKAPEVRARLNKQRRSQGVPEIDEPEMMEDMGKKYLEKTLIRDTVKKPFLEPIRRFMVHEPIQSKEGGEPLQAQAKEKAGRMTLEPGKGRVQT